MEIENWGVISYPEAWQRQTELFDELVNAKQEGRPYVNRIVFCQHPHDWWEGICHICF